MFEYTTNPQNLLLVHLAFLRGKPQKAEYLRGCGHNSAEALAQLNRYDALFQQDVIATVKHRFEFYQTQFRAEVFWLAVTPHDMAAQLLINSSEDTPPAFFVPTRAIVTAVCELADQRGYYCQASPIGGRFIQEFRADGGI